jgi:hypothetical protein
MQQQPRAQRAGMAAPDACSGLRLSGLDSMGAASGAAPRVAATAKDNAPRLAGTEGVKDQSETNTRDSAAAFTEGKALATMQARAAQAGCVLHELSGGGFLLCRWGMTKELPCLRAVGDLLRRLGGRHG